MRIRILFFLFILSVLALASCSNSNDTEGSIEKINLTISSAVSLTEALQELKKTYEEDHSVQLTFNFGGSGSLAQQIRQGAPVDVFISANEYWVDELADKNLILPETRSTVTSNRLVLITSIDSSFQYTSVSQIIPEGLNQIAIGNPESVPAGMYTRQALQNLNLWEDLESKFILGKDVRQVLIYVETGNVDIGFAYESDAFSSNKINILTTVPENLHNPITYPGAVLHSSKHAKEARDFLKFLTSEHAQQVFKKYGFRNRD